jgi:hypothetical protein
MPRPSGGSSSVPSASHTRLPGSYPGGSPPGPTPPPSQKPNNTPVPSSASAVVAVLFDKFSQWQSKP